VPDGTLSRRTAGLVTAGLLLLCFAVIGLFVERPLLARPSLDGR